MTGERDPGHAGGEDAMAAVMAKAMRERGWSVAQVRQAAEGAEMPGRPEDRPLWKRVAVELDALEEWRGGCCCVSASLRLAV